MLSAVYIVPRAMSDDISQPIQDPSCLLEVNRRSIETQRLLAQVRESNQELRCHCTKEKARMFVRFCHDNFTIVNHPTEGLHSDDCQLFSVIHGYSERQDDPPSQTQESIDVDSFVIHRAISDVQRTSVSKEKNSEGKPYNREHSIDKLFRFLCEKSYSNFHHKNKNQSTLVALRNLIEPTTSIAFGETTLNKYCFYGEKGYSFAFNTLRRDKKNNTYKGAGRPHALVFNVVEQISISNGCIDLDGSKYTAKRVIRAGRKTAGPYLVILSLADDPIEDAILVYNVFIKPIVSTTSLMPVDSNHERIIASGLISLISNSQNQLARWSLQKPIFSKNARSNSVSVLPDFILRRKSIETGKITYVEVIEVMGMLSDPDYAARKAQLLPLMKEAWRANSIYEINAENKSDIERFFNEHDYI
ncbi:DUF1173 family protein [Aliivibrio fischeri]|uniref:DUF1173 family protein n=1 Tax=Aliivibrio fischeri TaxID=668 RepID=UPI0007C4313B|nr:DUF1173 family protein [Aliivibrio fischeri]